MDQSLTPDLHAAATVPEPPASVTPQIPAESALRLYLLSVASVGAYLMVWAYRTGRRLEPDADRARHVSWAVAAMFPPFACLLLHEILRLARGQRFHWRGKDASARWPLLGAPAALMILTTLLYFTRVWPLWSLAWVVMPLPFAAVQHQLNRLARAEPVTAPPPLRTRALLVLIALGLPAVAAVGYRLDRGEVRALIASRRLPPGTLIHSRDGGYSLVVPGEGWRLLPPGPVDGSEGELSLSRGDGGAWAVAYSYPAADTSLDSAVDSRRQAISDASKVWSSKENRFFLKGTDLVPASLAEIGVQPQGTRRDAYIVLTAAVKAKVYEVVAYTNDQTAGRDELMRLLMSFQPAKDPP